MKKIKILDVVFDVVTLEEAADRVFNFLQNPHGRQAQIVTPNPEIVLEAQHNKPFRNVLNKAYLSIPDGMGVVWASTCSAIFAKHKNPFVRAIKTFWSFAALLVHRSFVHRIFPERVAGVDLMKKICDYSQKYSYKLFLLGAKPGVAQKTKENLEKLFSSISIVGTFDGSPRDEDFSAIQKLIVETKPDILFVAYGFPAQELWIAHHLKELPSVKIAMGVGGSFDFIAGVRKRAPEWLQNMGCEWMFRLAQDPARWRRIYNATIRFPLTVMRKK